MSNVPDDLYYTQSHEWVRIEGSNARVGITDHAQAELTDVVYVEVPKVGTKVEARGQIATFTRRSKAKWWKRTKRSRAIRPWSIPIRSAKAGSLS